MAFEGEESSPDTVHFTVTVYEVAEDRPPIVKLSSVGGDTLRLSISLSSKYVVQDDAPVEGM